MNERVTVKFMLLDKKSTALELRIGNGNLQQSEYLYNQAIAEITSKDSKGVK